MSETLDAWMTDLEGASIPIDVNHMRSFRPLAKARGFSFSVGDSTLQEPVGWVGVLVWQPSHDLLRKAR